MQSVQFEGKADYREIFKQKFSVKRHSAMPLSLSLHIHDARSKDELPRNFWQHYDLRATAVLLFRSKLGFSRILQTARFGGVPAFGYSLPPPKVNRFRWNLEQSKYIVGGWSWQILGAICAVARAEERGEFFLGGGGQVNNARLYRFPVGQFHEICAMNRSGTELWKFSQKKTKLKFFQSLATSDHAQWL